MSLTQFITVGIIGIVFITIIYKKGWMYTPFDKLEYENQLRGLLFDDIEQYSDPMEKLVKGLEHVYGPDWFKDEEIESNPIQRNILSSLVTVVIYNTLRPSKNEEEKEE